MRVIPPLEINDSNYSTIIPEPDSSSGEVEWVEDRLNYTTLGVATYAITTIGDKQFMTGSDGAAGVNVYVYQGGSLVDSWGAPDSSVKGIASDGTDIYLLGNPTASNTTATVYKHNIDGTPITSFVITPSQAYDLNVGVICHKNNSLYVYSKLATTHSTVTVYDDSTGGKLVEYDVSAFGYSINGLDASDDGFYVTALDVVISTLYSTDSKFTDFSKLFDTRVAGASTVDVSYDDSVFWFILGGFPYGHGYMSSDGKGLGVYLAGEQAIKTSTHKVYQAAANTTDDPEIGVNLVPPTWVEVGATNKYRAFDYVKNQQSTYASPLTMSFTVGVADTLAVFNTSGATTINVKMTDPTAGVVYDKDIDVIDITGVLNMWQYFLYQHKYVNKFVVDDLPPYPSSTVELTATNATAGGVSIGEVVIGRSNIIGVLVAGSSTDRKSYSNITIDEFGNQTVTKRPSATYTNFMTSLSTPTADFVESVLKEALDEPTLFVGDSVGGAKLIDLGYYERSPLVRSNPSRSEISIKVRGLV